MLTTLRKLDKRTRQGVLAGYIQGLLPNPDVTENASVAGGDYTVFFDQLTKELTRELHLKAITSESEKQLALRFLSAQMRANLIEPSKISDIRNRIGQKGILPLTEYQLVYADSFNDSSAELGVTKSMVVATIRDPDNIDHLLPDGQDSEEAITVVSKTFVGDDPFVLLVLCYRHKAVLRVDCAWMIFHSEIEISGITRASLLLAKFVDTYGMPILVAGRETKFVLYDAFTLTPGESLDRLVAARFSSGIHSDTTATYRVKGNVVEVICAFSINVSQYMEVLRSHGVTVTRTDKGVA